MNTTWPVFVGLGALWLLGGVLNFAGLRAGAATLVPAAVISLLYPLCGTALSLVACGPVATARRQ